MTSKVSQKQSSETQEQAPNPKDAPKVRKCKPYPQAQVIHYTGRISILDIEAPPIRFNGLVNFAVLLLGGMMIRLILENYLKYGLLVKIPGFEIERSDWIVVLICLNNLLVNFLASYFIERFAATSAAEYIKTSQKRTQAQMLADGVTLNKWILPAQMGLVFTTIFVPSVLIYVYMQHPLIGSGVMTFSVLLSIKIFSYSMTNLDLRRAYTDRDLKLENDILSRTKLTKMALVLSDMPIHVVKNVPIKYEVSYPDNVKLGNFLYFWFAPTLCYQPSYPRNEGPIRWGFIAKRLCELIFLVATIYCVCLQYAFPTLVNSVKAIEQKNQAWVSERVLKLSVVVSVLWLFGFYALFHSALNIIAELLRFSDRNFYLAWWNSSDLGTYWREWNLPIHYFCKRHIMVPLTSPPFNLSVDLGVFSTFFVSAVLHELIFGIPTRSLKGYSFFGMLLQIPLIKITETVTKLRGSHSNIGNALFWISFCIIGQPLLVLQYYYDWVQLHQL